MEKSPIVVLITVPREEVAIKIATILLEEKAAACVNIVPGVRSLYTWQGKVSDDQELLLICKSRVELFETRLVPAVKSVHPYELPEIVALPIVAGSPEYLDWIDESTR